MIDQNTRWYERPAWQVFALACAGVVLVDAIVNGEAAGGLFWRAPIFLSIVGAVIAVRQKRRKAPTPSLPATAHRLDDHLAGQGDGAEIAPTHP